MCLKRKMDELVDRKLACYYSKQAILLNGNMKMQNIEMN